ncbi:DUF6069 family protein [Micromonospora aurantiaca]|uniref:DUF6069 family protein n=1 Tax=Micromonospora aurantiaca (nom. illeg.) TaxID=47850 RepID=UPI0001BF28A0|nr:DUF6069 family protein [Micromonospora aurantiaca]ADL46817.1 hypothetical protein Micau_3289 [Micromonospora aurantiaca ATCC 27029]RNI00537.1 hypothetical protein EEZ25_19835 [Micromonospora aurantiaca]
METTIPTVTARPNRRRDRLLTVFAATAAALLGWVVAVPIAGVELIARSGSTDQRVTPVAVVVSTLLAGLAGWALLALLERLTARARTVWTVVAGLVLLVSLLGPLGGGVGGAATLTLVALHLVAGAVLITGLRRTAAR